MKKTILKGIAPAAFLVLTAACTDGYGTGFDDGMGKISLTADVDAAVVTGRSRAALSDITSADLSLRLTSADGSVSQTWASVRDFKSDTKFKVGAYTMEAFYGDEDIEGFDSPALYGSTTFTVTENTTTPVNITASVANALVSVDYTDNFKVYMNDYSTEIAGAGGSIVEYTADETRPAYVKAGTCEIFSNFTMPTGSQGRLNVATFEAVARRHYHVTVDLGGDGAGAVSLIINYIDDLETIERTIDISEDVMNAPAPTITADGFTPGTAIEFVPGQSFDKGFKFNIVALGGLGSVKLTTDSRSLTAAGWPAQVELIGASQQTQSSLKNLGLVARGIFTNPEKMAVLDLTDVLKHASYLNSGSNTSTFTLEVSDVFGKTAESVTFTATALEAKMNVNNASLLVGSSDLTFEFEFNAGDPAEVAKFSYANSRGTRTNFVPASIEKISEGLYKVTGKVEQANASTNLSLTVSAEGIGEKTVSIERQPMVITASGNVNAFASRAYVPVTIGDKDSDTNLFNQLIANASLVASTDGINFTPVTTTVSAAERCLIAEGLTPGQRYTVKVVNGSTVSEPVKTFTTESTRQIPNGNLDAATTNNGSSSNWENVVFQGWGTNNAMTTSQGGNFGYTRISGTKATNDAVSGNAVYIRTNGWGSGNTAVGTMVGECKYIDAGLLHLGDTRTTRPEGYSGLAGSLNTDDLNCGIEFDVRPKSVSFYYKYTAKNSADHGEVLVQVIDASGNTIAEGRSDLSAASSYTAVSVPLQYNYSSAKAAKIYVRFLSTKVASALAKDSNWLTPPSFGNLSRAEYYGSTLYVDEIVCNY